MPAIQHVLSPAADAETFSTPPSSPVDRNILDRPSLSRRGSRPTNLRIQQSAAEQWKPDVVLDNQQSPNGMSAKVTTPATAVPTTKGKAASNGGPHVAGSVASAVSPLSFGLSVSVYSGFLISQLPTL